jgi:hypothetical protein
VTDPCGRIRGFLHLGRCFLPPPPQIAEECQAHHSPIHSPIRLHGIVLSQASVGVSSAIEKGPLNGHCFINCSHAFLSASCMPIHNYFFVTFPLKNDIIYWFPYPYWFSWGPGPHLTYSSTLKMKAAKFMAGNAVLHTLHDIITQKAVSCDPMIMGPEFNKTGSTQPHEYDWGATWKKEYRLQSRKPRIRDPLCWPHNPPICKKLALTSSTSRGRSVGIVHSGSWFVVEFNEVYRVQNSGAHKWLILIYSTTGMVIHDHIVICVTSDTVWHTHSHTHTRAIVIWVLYSLYESITEF